MLRTIIEQVPLEHASYPDWLLTRHGEQPQLWYAGNLSLLAPPALAVTGVRELADQITQQASTIARVIAAHKYVLVSGWARGVDLAAMRSAWEAGGRVIGCLAGSLCDCVSGHEARLMLASGRALFLSLYGKHEPFSTPRAMARNRLLMRLAQAVIVIASREGQGGSWTGATAAIRARYRWGVPLLALVKDKIIFGEQCSAQNASSLSNKECDPDVRVAKYDVQSSSHDRRSQECLSTNASSTPSKNRDPQECPANGKCVIGQASQSFSKTDADNQADALSGNEALVDAGAIPLGWPLPEEFVQHLPRWLADVQTQWCDGGQAEFW